MKSILIILFVLFSVFTYSQNIEDAYKQNPDNVNIWPDALLPFDGEYQVFIDKLIWTLSEYLPNNAAISLGMEIVSYPFIPDDFKPQSGNHIIGNVRDLNTRVVSDGIYKSLQTGVGGNGATHYEGIGWEYGPYYIYRKVKNVNDCHTNGDMFCKGDYGLISQAYKNDLTPNDYQQCTLPHTIIKHTLYYHCGSTIESDVIDSIYWVYDNTRGKMKFYPFPDHTIPPDELIIDPGIDVTFRPTIIDFEGPWLYNSTSNSIIYSSGAGNGGSANYFPSEEVGQWDICGNNPGPNTLTPVLYFPPGTGGDYSFENHHSALPPRYFTFLIHPPPYMLIDAPILNFEGNKYAGYWNDGSLNIGNNEHTYTIDDPLDLTMINPKEKIIYNPSEVTVKDDITFPSEYQFLTLRGKYADKIVEIQDAEYFGKNYWETIPCFDFEYDRDYPVPVNCTTNEKCTSTYILDSVTLTIEPCVIIMDAHFEGKSTTRKGYIKYNPDCVYGNWTYDPATIVLIPDDFGMLGCHPIHESEGNKSSTNTQSQIEKHHGVINIVNSGKNNPEIFVNFDRTTDSKIQIFDTFGRIILEKEILSKDQSIHCTSLERGVYYVVLIVDGRVEKKQSFAKM